MYLYNSSELIFILKHYMKKHVLFIFALLAISYSASKAQVNGPIDVCMNVSNNYQTAFSGGYAWSVSPAGVANISDPAIQNPNITVVGTDPQYTITVVTSAPTNTFTLVVDNNTPAAPATGPSTICEGSTASLFASGVGSLGWYTTPTGGTSLFTGTNYITPPLSATTTYYVEDVYLTCPSVNRSPVTVTVNPMPVINISGLNAICAGQGVSLVANTMSGGPVSTYNWQPGSYTTSSITPTPPGTITYTLSVVNSFGCMNTFTHNVTVNPLPNILLNSQTICEGETAILPATGAVTYSWNTGAMGATIMVSPATTTTYTVTGSSSAGCVNTATCTVSVNPSTDISGTISTTLGTITADVYLLQYNSSQLIFDTIQNTTLGSNQYTFSSALAGDYLVKVVADTAAFPTLVPTYYGDDFQWDSALVINHGCAVNFTADITMIELPALSGTGFVSGHIIEDPGFGARINGTNHVMVPGGPLKGIDVKIGKNPGGGIQARTMSDTTGFYKFENLPADTFTIYVDIPGLPMDSSYHVIIAAGAETYTGLDYFADSNSVYPLFTAVGLSKPVNETANAINLFPNPSKENVKIRFNTNEGNKAQVELINIQGAVLFSKELNNLSKGKHEMQLNTGSMNIAPGVYFIRVKTNGGMVSEKLIVTE
jgi:hypothetical protein